MFRLSRLFRPARRIFPSPRNATQAYGSPPVVLHRVRLNRPSANLRNVLVSGAVVFGCYGVYASLVLSPVVKWLDENEKELTAHERKEMIEVEPLFIALPFTIRAKEPPPYTSNDPEWKEFVKISRDRKLQRKLRVTLASIVKLVSKNSAPLTAKCGKDIEISRMWLEFDYPYRPPMEYDRAGILVTDDDMVLTRRPVDSATVFRTSRILWPSPMMLSTWAFAGTLFRQNLYDISKLIGYEPKNPPVVPETPSNLGSQLPPTRHPDILKSIQRIKRQATSRPEEVKDPRAEASAQNRQIPDRSPLPGPPAGTGADADGKSSDTDGKSGEPGKTMTQAEMFLGHDVIRSLTSAPYKEFKKMFAKKWKTGPEPPARGSFLVSGLVEVATSKATILVDVAAWYNPQTRRYDARSMWLAIRRVQLKGQPLGR